MNSIFDDTFDNSFDNSLELKSIPWHVSSQIDILTDASKEFISMVATLESMEDKWKRAKLAREYLAQYGGMLKVNHKDLQDALHNPDSRSMSFWRQMYLIERAIPPKRIKQQDGTYTWSSDTPWVKRLKIFANTAIVEHAVVYKRLHGLPSELRFSRFSGDHDNLEAKPGEKAADFYCWDQANDKNYAFVELKCPRTANIEEAKNKYADSTSRYGARFVLMFLTDYSYKLIDYETDTIIDQPDLPVPDDLFIV